MWDVLSLLSCGDQGWGDELLLRAGVTLKLAFTTAPQALTFLVAWGKTAGNRVLRPLSHAFTTGCRSLPELLTLLIIHYRRQFLPKRVAGFFVSGSRLSLGPFAAGGIALTLVSGALGREVIRGAWQAVGKGQSEAAAALGMRRRHVFLFVVLPQMWRHSLPALGNL